MAESTHKLIVGPGRRSRDSYRRWSDDQKRQIVAETFVPGTSISAVARRHDMNANQLFQWRKEFAGESGVVKDAGLVPIRIISRRDDHKTTLSILDATGLVRDSCNDKAHNVHKTA